MNERGAVRQVEVETLMPGIDQCIANELLRLRLAGVLTWSSCCGHRHRRGFFLIEGEHSRQRVVELGYEATPWMPTALRSCWAIEAKAPCTWDCMPALWARYTPAEPIDLAALKRGGGVPGHLYLALHCPEKVTWWPRWLVEEVRAWRAL